MSHKNQILRIPGNPGGGCVPEPAQAAVPTGHVERTLRQELSSDPFPEKWRSQRSAFSLILPRHGLVS